MNKFTEYISSQFKNPNGPMGKVITLIQNIVNSSMYKYTVRLVSVKQNDKVLDIGYGNGYLLKKIYDKVPADLYGIDISDDAKSMAIKKNKKAASANKLHLEVGDCCDLPYSNEMFATITTINTVYFWSDTVKGLTEIRRCLKPGCTFYNVMFTREYLDTIEYTKVGYKKFDKSEMIEYGKQAGFANVEIREIAKNKSFVVIYTK